jgi:hypothetical protein
MKRQSFPALAICVGALATFGAVAGATPSAAASLIVQTEDGAVQGNVALGVENFSTFPMQRRQSANCAGARPSLPYIGAM